MQKGVFFGLLLVTLCVMPTLASAQDAPPVTNNNGFLSNPSILSNISLGADTRFPTAAFQAAGQIGTALVSALPNIMAGRRSYTPPIDMTTVLSAQY